MYVGEYLEESPLGKAEWLVALSELTDSRDKGIDVFREIPKRYQALKDLTASVEQLPYRDVQHPVERQLGDAFHPELHGTTSH